MKLKLLFHFSVIALIAVEAYRTYLILPFPGSQESEMVHVSHVLYHYRWIIRAVLLVGIIIGARKTFDKRKWIPVIELLFAGIVFYLANFQMTAENFFHEPEKVEFTSPNEAKVPLDALVISVTYGNESHAFPIRYLSYHHQVHDVIGGKNVQVTYCDVCRSGIVFDPAINGVNESFRLVGMDQFNAMFEDRTTKSWWMQANGECVAGELKGQKLIVIPSEQLTLAEWSKRYPNGKVMLPDPASIDKYGEGSFEKGKDNDELTRTDTASWQDKSWVIGIELNGEYRAYDWNQLKRERLIHDQLGDETIMITVDDENVNFKAYIVIDDDQSDSDTLVVGYVPSTLKPIPARQMFWHTWKTFYPETTRYSIPKIEPQ